jgi:hypothetical protein
VTGDFSVFLLAEIGWLSESCGLTDFLIVPDKDCAIFVPTEPSGLAIDPEESCPAFKEVKIEPVPEYPVPGYFFRIVPGREV